MPQSPAPSPHRQELDHLMERVYDEMRQLIRRVLGTDNPPHSLQPSALVNEVYLRLAASPDLGALSPQSILCQAATAARRVLVTHYRHRNAEKRGGGRSRHELRDSLLIASPDGEGHADLDALDAALDRLTHTKARCAQVVELRYFAGLSVEDTARAIGVSPATVKNDWAFAKAFLARDLASAKP